MTSNDHDSLVRRQFGTSAANYRTSASHARGESLSRLLELTTPRPDWLVLDVATGAGHTAAALATRVRLVIAGDTTFDMLQQAGLVGRDRGLTNILFVQESAQALAYNKGVFDLVTCRVAAHHFSDPEKFVAECSRVLKNSGRLVVIDNIVPADKFEAEWINDFERRRDPSHARCLGLGEWHDVFARYNLEVVSSEVRPKWFDFREWMQRMNVDRAAIERLEGQLFDAPEGVRKFWQPTRKSGRPRLALQEAILIGRPKV